MTAGELAALAALERSLRDCYLWVFKGRHTKKVVARASWEERTPGVDQNFRLGIISLTALLRHMHKRDGVTDGQLPRVRTYGGSIVRLLSGKTDPHLTDARNVRAHGNSLGSRCQSGLIEAVRDLIEDAYRDMINAMRGQSNDDRAAG